MNAFSSSLFATHTLPVRTPLEQPALLPMCRAHMDALGWNALDILLVSGDAYVDHPSFGVPLLGRWLVAHGFRTGIVAQPRWDGTGDEALADITSMGRPRLFAGVSAGAIDSMLAHYTAFRKKRHDDAYTPGGKAGNRPNRAVIVYAGLLRRAFPGLLVVGGGIEASLRRVAHYDFWTDAVRRSLLFDARLDLLIYGMGERALLEAARRVDGLVEQVGTDAAWWPPASQLFGNIPGTGVVIRKEEAGELLAEPDRALTLPSYESIQADPGALLEASLVLERETHQAKRHLVQRHGDRAVWLTPPAAPLTTEELDALYALPFSRKAHPAYAEAIPADAMIANSITTHRGCGGGCSFCSLALHQGRRIASRSADSVLREAEYMAVQKGFNGSVTDVGGPSANMWGARCRFDSAACTRVSCMFPTVCKGFVADQGACVDLLRQVQQVPGVKHVRVASGVRFDLALQNDRALGAYAGEFTGGQLKIAPEHASPAVLDRMRKPGLALFDKFLEAFAAYSRKQGKEQYVIPYLMSAFPGCTDAHMRELADWLKIRNWSPKQVQCFIPTPGTVATAMFHARQDIDGTPLFVAKSDAERLRQHAILLGETRSGDSRNRHAPRASHTPSQRTPRTPDRERGNLPRRKKFGRNEG